MRTGGVTRRRNCSRNTIIHSTCNQRFTSRHRRENGRMASGKWHLFSIYQVNLIFLSTFCRYHTQNLLIDKNRGIQSRPGMKGLFGAGLLQQSVSRCSASETDDAVDPGKIALIFSGLTRVTAHLSLRRPSSQHYHASVSCATPRLEPSYKTRLNWQTLIDER